MELEIYGVSKNELDSSNLGQRQGKYLGKYNGIEFKSNKYKIDNLEEFDYLHIFINGRIKQHSPKRFNKDIRKKLERIHVREFGECIQTSLF